jgi:hypothetical protein
VKVAAIRLDRMRLPPDPPFRVPARPGPGAQIDQDAVRRWAAS